MSEIDVERLKVDAGYWPDESEAFFYMPEGMFKPFFAKSAKHSDFSTGEMSGGWIGEKLNGDTYHVFSACWERIPRPTKQEWEGGPCQIDDDHPIRRLGELGNQAHNLGCELQNDEDLSDELGAIAVKLWDLEKRFRAKSKAERQREELAMCLQNGIEAITGEKFDDTDALVLANDLMSKGYNLEPKP